MKVDDLVVGTKYELYCTECTYAGTDIDEGTTVYVFLEEESAYGEATAWLLTEDTLDEVDEVPEVEECYCGHCYSCCGVSHSDFL